MRLETAEIPVRAPGPPSLTAVGLPASHLPARGVQAFALLVVIACFDIPRYLIDVFGIPLPPLGGNPPYLVPLVLPVLLFLTRQRVAAMEGEDFFFLICLFTWSLLEIFHGGRVGHTRWEIIAVNFWCYIFYFVFKQFDRFGDHRRTVVHACLVTAAAMSLFHIVMLVGLATPGFPMNENLVASELRDRNGISFLALLGIHLLLFYADVLGVFQRWGWRLGLSALFVSVMLLNRTRGAMIVLVMILLAHALLTGTRVKRLVLAALILAVGGVALSGGILETVSPKLSYVRAGLDFRAPTAEDFELFSWDNSDVSTYSRVRTNLLCLESFFSNPFTGVGLHESFRLRVAGYMSHTYYLLIACAYGLIGVLPYFLFFKGLVYPPQAERFKRSAVSLALIVGILSFINDFPSWFSILFFLLRHDGPRGRRPPGHFETSAP